MTTAARAWPLLLSALCLQSPSVGAEVVEPPQETVVRERGPALSAGEVVLDEEALARKNRRSTDDLLRAAPGVHVVQHGSDGKGPQLFLRGFDAAHGADVEVRLDGVPLGEPSNIHGHGYLDLGLVIPELVTSVELTPGAFALKQGPFALAGSLELSTGVARRGLSARYEIGDTQRHRAVALYGEGPTSPESYTALELLHDGGFGTKREHQRVAVARRDAWDVGDVRVDVGVLGATSFFALPGLVRVDDVERGRLGLYESYGDEGEGASLRALAHGGVRWREHPWRASARAWTGLRHLRLDDNYTGFVEDARGDRFLQRHSAWSGGATGEASVALLPRTRAYGLVEVRAGLATQSATRLSLGGLPFGRSLARDFHYGLGAAGLGVRTTLLPGVRLDAGLRTDVAYDQARFHVGFQSSAGQGSGALSPRLRLSFATGVDGLRGFVALGRGVRPPEVGLSRGATAPLVLGGISVAEQAEAGVRYRAADDALDVALAAWGSYVSAELLFDHPTGTTVAASSSGRVGADLRVAYRPVRAVTLGSNLTVTDARFLPDDDAGLWLDGEPVPGVPPLLALVDASWRFSERGLVAATARALAPRPLRYGASSPGVVVFDALLRYDLDVAVIDLQIDNVLDTAYAEGAYSYTSRWHPEDKSELPAVHVAPGPPRLVRLGVTVPF